MKATFRNISIILSTVILLSGGVMISGCSTFGTKPGNDDMLRVEQSPNYNREQRKFINRRPGIVKENMDSNFKFRDIIEWLKGPENGVPGMALPEIKPDMKKFTEYSQDPKVIWFGHSSILLNIAGKNILIDPVFSDHASPFNFMVKRFQKPVLNLSELPEIDYIVISHDHYDHLDMKTVKFFKDKHAEFILALGTGSHLRGWGIDSQRITELDWWGKTEKGNIEFIAAPAQHFSGRSFSGRDSTLWASWIIKAGKMNIFFSGDSGYDTHFKDIGRKYGPFDLAFIETGQYNEKWREVHMLPDEAAQAYFDLNARRYFPIHWGMFELALHPWYQPASDISKEADSRKINLITPMLGEIITIDKGLKTGRWWEPEIAELSEKSNNRIHVEVVQSSE
ncbi:MAG TPA: MBL fold metallo-hydrolase [Spirochaetota bacterium]|nr:MBL fold metallo-hydrolase [Spirochaetota bacterium]HPJ36404.1 MBL fold metallo-hydrolase [Spirochaetota bacterium]